MCHLSPIVYTVFFSQCMLPLMSIVVAECGNISLFPLCPPQLHGVKWLYKFPDYWRLQDAQDNLLNCRAFAWD